MTDAVSPPSRAQGEVPVPLARRSAALVTDALPAIDVALAVAAAAAEATGRAATALARLTRPLTATALRPPLVPRRYWPATALESLAARGRQMRTQAGHDVVTVAGALIPLLVDAVLDRIDITQLVIDRVKIDRIVAEADLDAAAARLALDPIIARLDLDAIVATVALEPIIARIDVDAIVATVDLDAIIARIDLAALANQVIDEIDLPEIIRESSGAMASETVVGVRMQAAEADEKLNRLVDRLLLRRHDRDPGAPRAGTDG